MMRAISAKKAPVNWGLLSIRWWSRGGLNSNCIGANPNSETTPAPPRKTFSDIAKKVKKIIK